ncbi:unnamed protein product [Caenorhabditis angaria]|uniref:Phospholipid/glycerol acyltransferase domain-containing protein n=1 Tax=Caenorhabditis angaria TaxID=860376 RepID=A0A9P1N9L1_9PELO|nr:unnamed protein product [Caenorhabditis angaria]
MNAAGDNGGSLFKNFVRQTSFKRPEMNMNFEFSNARRLDTHCDTCFPMIQEQVPSRGNYVDLLEFSNFNGIPYPILDESKKPSRWFADIRYCMSTPLPHNYPSVTKDVLTSPRVESTIQTLLKTSNTSVSSLRSKAVKFFKEIQANLSKFVCKICSYLLYKVFRRLMTKLLVCPDELNRIRKAEESGIPIVYLPLHRSHLDYLLITWCNWHFRLKLPHIASGDNLNLSGLGWLLRATGAFFIRRRVNPDDEGGKDVFYRAILHSYIEQVLKKDLPIEFFLEGTRNRFGKVLPPKNGLISNVVQAVQQGIIKDCYLVPVSYTYDAVVEGVFLNELMGIPKVRESVMGVFKGIFDGFSKSKQCGIVRMHYGRPVLLTTYLSAMTAALACKNAKPTALTRLPHSFSYRELVPWHRTHSETVDDRSMIRAIGFHVVHEAQMMCSISAVSIVSCLLLAKFRKGADIRTLEHDTIWLCEKIIAGGGDVVGYTSNETTGETIVKYALKKIENCVEYLKDQQFVRPILEHKSLVNLAYNKNAIICRFSIKSALALSLVCREMGKMVNIEEIIDDTMSLCDWLQYDFLFAKPCDDLREICHDILSTEHWSHPVNGVLRSDYEDMGGFGDVESQNQPVHVRIKDENDFEILVFYSNLIRPFIQSLYIVTTFVASPKCAENPIPENKFVRDLCQAALAEQEGYVKPPFEPLLESINSDSFKNSIRTLREKGFLSRADPNNVCRSKNGHINEVVSNLQRVLRLVQ